MRHRNQQPTSPSLTHIPIANSAQTGAREGISFATLGFPGSSLTIELLEAPPLPPSAKPKPSGAPAAVGGIRRLEVSLPSRPSLILDVEAAGGSLLPRFFGAYSFEYICI
jgi:hypothetical protein